MQIQTLYFVSAPFAIAHKKIKRMREEQKKKKKRAEKKHENKLEE